MGRYDFNMVVIKFYIKRQLMENCSMLIHVELYIDLPMILSNAHFVWMLISRLQNLQCVFNAANFIQFFCTYDMQDVWKFNMECPLIIREFGFRFFHMLFECCIKARILIKVLLFLFHRKAEVFKGLCIQRDIRNIWIVLKLRLNSSCLHTYFQKWRYKYIT